MGDRVYDDDVNVYFTNRSARESGSDLYGELEVESAMGDGRACSEWWGCLMPVRGTRKYRYERAFQGYASGGAHATDPLQ